MGKLERLRQMTGAEIAHRVREKMLIEWERARVQLGMSSRFGKDPPPRFGCPPSEMPKFYFDYSVSGRERLSKLVRRQFPEWESRALDEAEKICRSRLPLLCDGDLNLGSPINWNRDPISGRSWGRCFWADYDPVRDPFAGDPKVILELNRHRHLPKLGKAFFLTGEDRFAREAVSHMLGWIDQCPPSRGINWQSSLDIALRAINWTWTLILLSHSNSLNESASEKIHESLRAQIKHVYSYPSTYSSPNTHLIGEAACLLIAGLIFRNWNEAPAWLKLGSTLLARELDHQVSAEGVHAELSSYYHCYTLDLYMQSLVLARRNGFAFPEHAWQKLSLMIEFLLHLSRPDGSIPLLGDDDGGRALGLVGNDYHSYREALCTGAVLFRREDFKHQADGFHEETLWLLGPESFETYRSLHSVPPSGLRAAYPDAGYFIQRSGWSRRDSHIVFDCGRFGMESGGHSHGDALSFDLSVQGHPVLIDPGTYVYTAAPEWRNYFRSTRAHNTAVIDGRDQSAPGAPFKWNSQAIPRLNRHLSTDEADYLECEHDGYLKPQNGVVHRRRLLHLPPHGWAVLDDFRGSGQHTIDLFYHFAPGVELSPVAPESAGSSLQILARVPAANTGLCLFISSTCPMDAEIIMGCEDPIQGWVSTGYGRKEPAPVLRMGCKTAMPAAFLSLLMPLRSETQQNRTYRPAQVSGESALACELKSEGLSDLVLISTGGSEVSLGSYAMSGDFFWVRETDGRIRYLLAVNARSFGVGGSVIFREREPIGQVWARFDGDRVEMKRVGSKEKLHVWNLRHRKPEFGGAGGQVRRAPNDGRYFTSRPG